MTAEQGETPRVDSILTNWFGESLECMENEEAARKHLYTPLRTLEAELSAALVRAERAEKELSVLKARHARVWRDGT